MGSNILVRDALWRVSDALQDTGPQFVRWTQTTLVQALNDGQRVIAKYLPSSCSRIDVIKLVPGTKQMIDSVPAARLKFGDGTAAVDLRGNRLISPPTRNMGADGATPGRVPKVIDRMTLDRADPLWHTRAADTVVKEVMVDPLLPQVFFVNPPVHAITAVWLEIPWLPDPIEIPVGAAGDYALAGPSPLKLSINDSNLDDLVNYILARAYLKDAEAAGSATLAATHTQLFVSSINTQAVAAGLPNPKLQALPVPAGG